MALLSSQIRSGGGLASGRQAESPYRAASSPIVYQDAKPQTVRTPGVGIGVCRADTYPCAVKGSLARKGDSDDPERGFFGELVDKAGDRVLEWFDSDVEKARKETAVKREEASAAAADPNRAFLWVAIAIGGFILAKRLG